MLASDRSTPCDILLRLLVDTVVPKLARVLRPCEIRNGPNNGDVKGLAITLKSRFQALRILTLLLLKPRCTRS